jgi:hypothetical protein
MGLLNSRKNLADLYISRLEQVGTAVSSNVGNTSSNLNRAAQLKAVIGGHRSFLIGREHLVKPKQSSTVKGCNRWAPQFPQR